MRLLNVRAKKLHLRSFTEQELQTKQYAILSHCWSFNNTDEVSLEDIQKGTADRKKGFIKVSSFAQQARNDGFDWAWIDTCCIDRRSSSELSEAINSMFAWYRNSARCYAYLEDITESSAQNLAQSRWFSRCWTLQELIAPIELLLYDSHWRYIGSKQDPEICVAISDITGIDMKLLTGNVKFRLPMVSIARRMSWAANRRATRGEDIAYSLMGIFNVNMPMLYGEGSVKAFHRLQEQIMRDSNDHSIFAWRSSVKTSSGYGLLADSPEDFAGSANILPYHDWENSAPYQLSNHGLRIELYMTRLDDGDFIAALNCPIPSTQDGQHGFIAITLRKLPTGANQYARVRCDKIMGLTQRGAPEVIYVRQAIAGESWGVMPRYFFSLRQLHQSENDLYGLAGGLYAFDIRKEEEYANTLGPVPQTSLEVNNWIATLNSSVFRVVKVAGALSAALNFRRISDGASITLLLGCLSNLDVGFDLVEDPLHDFGLLAARFTPRLPGVWMNIGSHFVRVDIERKIDGPCRIYLVDITITTEAVEELTPLPSLFSPLNSADIQTGVIDYIVDQTTWRQMSSSSTDR